MSQAIKIGGGQQQPKKQQVPQSLPANFYRGYVPPKTPQINPIPEPQMIDELDLPPPSQENVGINLDTGSFSLKNNTHPMSMPVNSGLMMGGGLKNRLALYSNNNKNKAIPEIKEDDGGANEITNGVSNVKLQVGSLTSFAIMGGDNQSMSSFADQDDMGDSDLNTNETTTNNTDKNKNNQNKDESQKDQNIDDGDDGQFGDDMDDDTQFDMDED